jgi:hypothetical protein
MLHHKSVRLLPSISLDACEHRRDLAERPPRLSLAHTNREPTEGINGGRFIG